MAQAVEKALERTAAFDRRGWNGNGQDAGLSSAGDPLRQARDHLHRHQEPAGTALLQGYPIPWNRPLPWVRANCSVCYMKGRNNYLCRKKLYDLTDQPVLSGLQEIEQYRAIAEWEETHAERRSRRTDGASGGQRSYGTNWTRARNLHRTKMQQWDRCFITEMRRRAAESDIIIVNHHLFFADLGIKQQAEYAPDAGILPDVGCVIFDEAHELEDVAGSYFGVSVSNLAFRRLVPRCGSLVAAESHALARIGGGGEEPARALGFFFALLPPGDGRFAFENRREFLEENGDEFMALQQAAHRAWMPKFRASPQKPEEVFNFARRAQELQVQLGFLLESEDSNTVFWIERRRGAQGRQKANAFLQATPIDVGPILKPALFEKLECAVLTSATLAVGGGFEYMRRRLGLEHARELVLPSHFDYQSQALFYVPPDLPDPRTPQFCAKAAERIRRLLEIYSVAGHSCFSPATRR